MRLILALLGLLLAMLASLLWLTWVPEPTAVNGALHPDIATMRIGGDGLARLGQQWMVLAGLQYLTLAVVYTLMAISVPQSKRTGLFWTLLVGSFSISICVCWVMMSSYISYLQTGQLTYLLGYPLPTAMMLFGVFLGGCFLCALYCFGFSRFIYTEQDKQAYAELLTATSASANE